jgi:hypothetical protein
MGRGQCQPSDDREAGGPHLRRPPPEIDSLSHSEMERMSIVVHYNEHLYRPYAFSSLEIIFDYLA